MALIKDSKKKGVLLWKISTHRYVLPCRQAPPISIVLACYMVKDAMQQICNCKGIPLGRHACFGIRQCLKKKTPPAEKGGVFWEDELFLDDGRSQ